MAIESIVLSMIGNTIDRQCPKHPSNRNNTATWQHNEFDFRTEQNMMLPRQYCGFFDFFCNEADYEKKANIPRPKMNDQLTMLY